MRRHGDRGFACGNGETFAAQLIAQRIRRGEGGRQLERDVFGGGKTAVRHHQHGVSCRVLAQEGEPIRAAGQGFLAAPPQRRMFAADLDQPAVVGAQVFIARQAAARSKVELAPRHVATIGRPVAAHPADFVAVINRR